MPKDITYVTKSGTFSDDKATVKILIPEDIKDLAKHAKVLEQHTELINNHADIINAHDASVDTLKEQLPKLKTELEGKADLSWVKEVVDQAAAHESLLTGTKSAPGLVRKVADLAGVEQRLRDAIREGKWMADFTKAVKPLISELDQRHQTADAKLIETDKRLSEIRSLVQSAERLHSGFESAISSHERRLNEILVSKLKDLSALHHEAQQAHRETIALRETLALERAAQYERLIAACNAVEWNPKHPAQSPPQSHD